MGSFLASVEQAEVARPRVGSDMSTMSAKPMVRSTSEPAFLGPSPRKPIRDDRQVIAGYQGHIPGAESKSWRWVGKTFQKGVYNETFDNWAKKEAMDEVQQYSGSPDILHKKNLFGYGDPDIVAGYQGHIKDHTSKSWRSAGCSFRQGLANVRLGTPS